LPNFSFIVPYRNREPERVGRCLASLQAQTYRDFEVIFSDYGSEPERQAQTEALCAQFDRVRYQYYPMRGRFWSRAQALNLGIARATGQHLVMVDIDLIYSPHFAEKLAELAQPESFLHYQCYYLPENYTDYARLDFNRPYPYPASTFTGAGGLTVLPRAALAQIGPYHEYFRVWGMEDMEMLTRLQRANYQSIRVPVASVANFHQWHPGSHRRDSVPDSWHRVMEQHASALPPQFVPQPQPLPPARPLLDPARQWPVRWFEFDFPFVRATAAFAQQFYGAPAGTCLAVRQTVEALRPAAPSRLSRYGQALNRWLDARQLAYRLVEVNHADQDLLDYYAARDFLFYFIIENEAALADYTFNCQYPTLDVQLLRA
jgi:GT2 family glycosyltransferase